MSEPTVERIPVLILDSYGVPKAAAMASALIDDQIRVIVLDEPVTVANGESIAVTFQSPIS